MWHWVLVWGLRLTVGWGVQIEMTPTATSVPPSTDAKEKKLLEAKYKIFLEQIDIQKRWRKEMEEASR